MAGKSFIKLGQVGIGTQTTTERNAGVSTATGTIVYNVTDGALQFWDGASWRDLSSSLSSSGGVKDTAGRSGYVVHTFTSSANFSWSGGPISDCEYVVIGGGGAGGDYAGPYPGYNAAGSGGGAGGMRSGTFTLPSAGTDIPLTIGSGGASSVTATPWTGANNAPAANKAQPGTPTTLPSSVGISGGIVSQGGGRGGTGNAGPHPGTPSTYAADPGGSGGGAVRDVHTTAGSGNRVVGTSTPAPSQGSTGGPYNGPDGHGGGGGGAGSTGGAATSSGPGGSGSSTSITGSSKTHAGGGGGGAGNNPTTPGPGTAGGGNGGATGDAGSDASISSGAGYGSGGGGAGRGGETPAPSEPGGSGNGGVIIIAIPTA